MYKIQDIESIHFEATSYCNAKCPMCSRYDRQGRVHPSLKFTHLDKKYFYKILEPLKNLKFVYFSGVYGDPCMHPDLLEFVKYLKKIKKVRVNIDTNASLQKSQFWKALADYGAYINFAIDGLEDTNHIYRQNTNYKNIIQNVETFCNAGGSGQWNFIVFEHNQHQVDKAKKIAADLGLNFRIKITPKFIKQKNWLIFDNSGQQTGILRPPTIDTYRHNNTSNKQNFSTETIYNFDLKDPKYERPIEHISCKAKIKKEFYVSHDGYVLPCCYIGSFHGDGPQAYQIRSELNLDNYNIKNNNLLNILENFIHIENKWSIDKISKGRLIKCGEICGTKVANQTKFIVESDNSSFCILPWIHLQNKPNGQIKPCCRFDHKHEDYKDPLTNKFIFDKFNVNKISYNDAIFSKEWDQIRSDMIHGNKVSGCHKCYKENNYVTDFKNITDGNFSMRLKENFLWNKNVHSTNIENNNVGKLRFLEFGLGNYCNLKCRTCANDLSTTWSEDEKILSGHYEDRVVRNSVLNINKFWQKEDFKHVELIKFTGGEPMIHPNFLNLIEDIINAGNSENTTLQIYTNASWIPKEKILNKLNVFKQIEIYLSIDGTKKVNDYIRFPSKWSIVSKSALKWLEHANKTKNYDIKWAPCISVYNVLDLHNMMEWWFQINLQVKGDNYYKEFNNNELVKKYLNIVLNVAYYPKYTSPSIITQKDLTIQNLIKEKNILFTRYFEKYLKKNQQEQILSQFNHMYKKVIDAVKIKHSENELTTFLNFSCDLDKIRKQNFYKSLPQLSSMYIKEDYVGRI